MEIQYIKQGDYLLPNLLPPQDSDGRPIGKYGRMRLSYLKNHQRVLYTNLLTTGKLHSHLREVDEQANTRMELLTRQMAEAQGVTEQLKAKNQLDWVGAMNNIRSSAEEVVLVEIVYQ